MSSTSKILLLGSGWVGREFELGKLSGDIPLDAVYEPRYVQGKHKTSLPFKHRGKDLTFEVWILDPADVPAIGNGSIVSNRYSDATWAIVCYRQNEEARRIAKWQVDSLKSKSNMSIILCSLDNDKKVFSYASRLSIIASNGLGKAFSKIAEKMLPTSSNGFLESLLSDMCDKLGDPNTTWTQKQLNAVARIYQMPSINNLSRAEICEIIQDQQKQLSGFCYNDVDVLTYDTVTSIPLPFVYKHDGFCFNVLDAVNFTSNPFTRKEFTVEDKKAMRKRITDLDIVFLK